MSKIGWEKLELTWLTIVYQGFGLASFLFVRLFFF
jgi:hypothetical protein